MPTGNVWNIGWLNANSTRSYPISEVATRYDVTNSIQIPNDFIVDMVFMVPASYLVDTSKFYIQSIAIFSLGAIVTVGYDTAGAVGVASISTTGFTGNATYRIVGEGQFSDATGSITIGSFAGFSSTIPGFYNFDITGARIEASVIKPDIRGVASISISNGTETSDKLHGDIVLVAGQNVVFSVVPEQNAVRIDAVPTTAPTTCPCSTAPITTAINTVNGIYPDRNGNVTLQGTDCLTITGDQSTYSLEFDDTCAQPCCGCQELQVIQTDLAVVQSQAATIQGIVSNLQAQLEQLATLVAL